MKMLSKSLAQRILQRFPGKLTYCFAYGSGVKKQTGYNDKAQKDAMIDLMFSVDDPYEFHKLNLEKNPHDYSFMRFFGSEFIGQYQDYACGVYCNTLIPIDSHTTIKYGVMRTKDMCDDLYHWSHLYVAGRLQKPTETLIEPTDQEIIDCLDKNLENALRTALLILPKEFTYYELFHEIANISYHMDFRMVVGETKDKVTNIVEPQQNAFLKLYAPYLKRMKEFVDVPDYTVLCDKRIQQDKSHSVILKQLEALPTRLHMTFQDLKFSIENLAHATNLPLAMRISIGKINWESSLTQTAKNIPTAGIIKSLRYGTRKFLKTFSK